MVAENTNIILKFSNKHTLHSTHGENSCWSI